MRRTESSDEVKRRRGGEWEWEQNRTSSKNCSSLRKHVGFFGFRFIEPFACVSVEKWKILQWMPYSGYYSFRFFYWIFFSTYFESGSDLLDPFKFYFLWAWIKWGISFSPKRFRFGSLKLHPSPALLLWIKRYNSAERRGESKRKGAKVRFTPETVCVMMPWNMKCVCVCFGGQIEVCFWFVCENLNHISEFQCDIGRCSAIFHFVNFSHREFRWTNT